MKSVQSMVRAYNARVIIQQSPVKPSNNFKNRLVQTIGRRGGQALQTAKQMALSNHVIARSGSPAVLRSIQGSGIIEKLNQQLQSHLAQSIPVKTLEKHTASVQEQKASQSNLSQVTAKIKTPQEQEKAHKKLMLSFLDYMNQRYPEPISQDDDVNNGTVEERQPVGRLSDNPRLQANRELLAKKLGATATHTEEGSEIENTRL